MPPITPEQVIEQRVKDIPEAVLDAWNSVIAKNFTGSARGGTARFNQGVIVEEIISKLGCTSREVFDNHWLDVEPIYREAGWEVKYDRPGYNESYEDNFEFHFRKR